MKYQNTKFSFVAIHLFYQKVKRRHSHLGKFIVLLPFSVNHDCPREFTLFGNMCLTLPSDTLLSWPNALVSRGMEIFNVKWNVRTVHGDVRYNLILLLFKNMYNICSVLIIGKRKWDNFQKLIRNTFGDIFKEDEIIRLYQNIANIWNIHRFMNIWYVELDRISENPIRKRNTFTLKEV